MTEKVFIGLFCHHGSGPKVHILSPSHYVWLNAGHLKLKSPDSSGIDATAHPKPMILIPLSLRFNRAGLKETAEHCLHLLNLNDRLHFRSM
jgi:hypothetical protein